MELNRNFSQDGGEFFWIVRVEKDIGEPEI
jgi:hypothetical protein